MGRDTSYSDAVEINQEGYLEAVRDIKKGEIVQIPVHMFDRARPMNSEEREAYASGRAAFLSARHPGDDRFVINPYDTDDHQHLHEAWQAGFDSA